MIIRDRIKEFRRVRASELLPNPKNWRTHPTAQRNALEVMLTEVGYADALIARETEEGLMLVDGHLRAETTPDADVPVLVLDIDEEEADLILATLDPMAAMAGHDENQLLSLLGTIQTSDQAVTDLLETIQLETIQDTKSFVQKNPYSQKIEVPIYTPTGPPPDVEELTDREVADELINEIKQAKLPPEIEAFLLDAAERHVGFHFEKIANYYANAPEDIQSLMEKSGLVIVDYDKALEYRFTNIHEEITEAFLEDYPDA